MYNDNSKQYEALSKFSSQISFALEHYTPHNFKAENFTNIIIAGLGGSGIGGRIAKSFFSGKISLPIEVVSDYVLPKYAGKNTLLILSSYSGSTEETLAMYEEGKKAECSMLAITSGGTLQKITTENNIKTYPVESGFQPRMALGYSLTYQILIFGELSGIDYSEELKQIIENTGKIEEFRESADEMFEGISNNIEEKIIIVTDAALEAVGIRFAQQVQENAKTEAFVHVLPEANHNVIESYYGHLDSVFFFIKSMSNDRVSHRFEFLGSLLEVENNKVVSVSVMEYSLRTIFETIFRLDFVSLYLADARNVDALNVPNIASLKEFLEQVDAE